ncbi:MAG TPA: efflux RND transporter permease subunit [Flavobacterium sp.]
MTLLGLAAKNAILIVEFAKERVDRGKELVVARIEAVTLSLRPIVKTSLAFYPWYDTFDFLIGHRCCLAANHRLTVAAGMTVATIIAIFIVRRRHLLLKPQEN